MNINLKMQLLHHQKLLARELGFEPRSKVLETRMLPLHHSRVLLNTQLKRGAIGDLSRTLKMKKWIKKPTFSQFCFKQQSTKGNDQRYFVVFY